ELKAVFLVGRTPATPAFGKMPIFNFAELLNIADLADAPLPRRAIDIDLAALVYTSGSTGRPKGVMLTHQNMVSTTTSINAYLQNTSDDIILNVLSLAFGYGLYQILTAFQVCATV